MAKTTKGSKTKQYVTKIDQAQRKQSVKLKLKPKPAGKKDVVNNRVEVQGAIVEDDGAALITIMQIDDLGCPIGLVDLFLACPRPVAVSYTHLRAHET